MSNKLNFKKQHKRKQKCICTFHTKGERPMTPLCAWKAEGRTAWLGFWVKGSCTEMALERGWG